MYAGAPVRVPAADEAELDRVLDEAPPGPGVFLIILREGSPYLGHTGVLRRRLRRLLGPRSGMSRRMHLRDLAVEVAWWVAPSRIESSLTLYELAKTWMPDRYLQFLKLRMPAYVKLTTGNAFPRTQVTSRWTGEGLYFGPFRTRGAAERFDQEFLDLFQIRRCQEELSPSPDHPGCAYGEMNRCLRPCQLAVTGEEYASEVARVAEFLITGGKKLKESACQARDRLSVELDFEAAAREHRRVERIDEILRFRDELVSDARRLCGVIVGATGRAGSVRLWFLRDGLWLAPVDFDLQVDQSVAVSMDRRLREVVSGLPDAAGDIRDRQEHLAILTRWYNSSWRDGDWIPFESVDKLSYRRLVAAISRVARDIKPA